MILSYLDYSNNTGAGIFKIMDDESSKRNIPWKRCIAFVSDSANTMIGHSKGVISFIKNAQSCVHFQGFACYCCIWLLRKVLNLLSSLTLEFLRFFYNQFMYF